MAYLVYIKLFRSNAFSKQTSLWSIARYVIELRQIDILKTVKEVAKRAGSASYEEFQFQSIIFYGKRTFGDWWKSYQVNYIGIENLHKARSQGRSLLFVGLHHGCSTLAPTLLAQFDEKLMALLLKKRADEKIAIQVELEKNAMIALPLMVRHLGKGHSVFLTLDGGLSSGDLSYQFLSNTAQLGKGFPALVRATDSTILPVLLMFDKNEKAINFHIGEPTFTGDLKALSDAEITKVPIDFILKTLEQEDLTQVNYSYFAGTHKKAA